MLEEIAQSAGTKGTERELMDAGLLAKALLAAGRVRESEEMQREIVRQAEERGQFRVASTVMNYLITLLRQTGRSEEALGVIPTKKEYTRRCDLGPWSQLSDEGIRLQLLNALGRHEEVLKAVEQVREEMRNLPDTSEKEEFASPWNVREMILDTGREAALRLGQWQEAIVLNAERVESEVDPIV